MAPYNNSMNMACGVIVSSFLKSFSVVVGFMFGLVQLSQHLWPRNKECPWEVSSVPRYSVWDGVSNYI